MGGACRFFKGEEGGDVSFVESRENVVLGKTVLKVEKRETLYSLQGVKKGGRGGEKEQPRTRGRIVSRSGRQSRKDSTQVRMRDKKRDKKRTIQLNVHSGRGIKTSLQKKE